MTDYPKTIHLLPDADGPGCHLWCEDPVHDDEMLPEPVKYVRVDAQEALLQRTTVLSQEIDKIQHCLKKLHEAMAALLAGCDLLEKQMIDNDQRLGSLERRLDELEERHAGDH